MYCFFYKLNNLFLFLHLDHETCQKFILVNKTRAFDLNFNNCFFIKNKLKITNVKKNIVYTQNVQHTPKMSTENLPFV